MFDFLKKSWYQKNNMETSSLPLYELIIVLLNLIGITIAWVITFFQNELLFLSPMIVIYLCLANNHEITANLVKGCPVLYRSNKYLFYKYASFLIIKINILLFMLVPYLLSSIIMNLFTGNILFIFYLLSILLSEFQLIIINSFQMKSNVLFTSLTIFTIIGNILALNNYINRVCIIYLFFVNILIFIFSLKPISQYVYQSINYNNIQGPLFLSIFKKAILYKYKENLIVLCIYMIYFFLAVKYNFFSGIIPLIAIFVIFEMEVHLQITTNNRNYNNSRVLFLSNSQWFKKIFFGNFFYKIIGYIIVNFVLIMYLLVIGKINYLQTFLTYIFIILITIFCTVKEELLLSEKRRTPTFLEEYIIMILAVCLFII